MQIIMSFGNIKYSLFFSILCSHQCIDTFSSLITLSRTSIVMLNRSGESLCPRPVPDIKRKKFSLSFLSFMKSGLLSRTFSFCFCYYWKFIMSEHPAWATVCICWDGHMASFMVFLIGWICIDLISNVNQLGIP